MRWRRAIALSVLIAGCGLPGLLPVNAARKTMTPDQVLQEYGIATRVGQREIPPRDGATREALETVEKSNSSGRLEGLADDLNPTILDAGKVKAFFTGLPKVPASTLDRLRGATIHLNDPKLQLYAYSPVTSATLELGYTLTVGDGSRGQIARVRLDAPIDLKMARERANRAKQAMLDADREAAALEKEKQKPEADATVFVAHSEAQRRRYAAASVWRDLVSALSRHDTADAALRSEASQAKEAAARYVVAPWTGMPR
jgi:hypothetical protein